MKKIYFLIAGCVALATSADAQTWTKIANTPDTASYSSNHFNSYNLGDTVLSKKQNTLSKPLLY